jgi:hypothetical protein
VALGFVQGLINAPTQLRANSFQEKHRSTNNGWGLWAHLTDLSYALLTRRVAWLSLRCGREDAELPAHVICPGNLQAGEVLIVLPLYLWCPACAMDVLVRMPTVDAT